MGITRAEKELTLTSARQRVIHGETRYERPSRFLDEIPEEYIERDRQENSVFSRRPVKQEFDDSELPWGRSAGGFSSGGYSSGGFSSAGFSKSSAYASKTARPAPEKPNFGKAFTVQKADSLDYSAGDRVHHDKFGEGTVKNIEDGGKDYEVTVEFDTIGVRKMYASFAKLKKL